MDEPLGSLLHRCEEALCAVLTQCVVEEGEVSEV